MESDCVAIEKSAKKGIEDSFKAFMSKYYSRGPMTTKVFMASNCVTVYCKDILTNFEKALLEDDESEMLIKIFRQKIIKKHELEFLNIVRDNVDRTVNSFFIDFNTKDNSLASVFVLDD